MEGVVGSSINQVGARYYGRATLLVICAVVTYAVWPRQRACLYANPYDGKCEIYGEPTPESANSTSNSGWYQGVNETPAPAPGSSQNDPLVCVSRAPDGHCMEYHESQ
jgi:hypothetical protein